MNEQALDRLYLTCVEEVLARGIRFGTLQDTERFALVRCMQLLEDTIRIQGMCIDHRELLDRLKDAGD